MTGRIRGKLASGLCMTLMLPAVLTWADPPASETLVPSGMSLAMFKAGRVKEPTVFRVKVAVAAQDTVWYDGESPRSEDRDKYWEVRVVPEQSEGDTRKSRLRCYILKDSAAGKTAFALLKDGAFHSAFVKIHCDDFYMMDEIQPISSLASPVKAKFTATRLGITMSNPFNYLQGRIAVSFRSKNKYFKKPILRVVALVEENGSRVVRDCIVDEPNVKMLEDNDDSYWWRYYDDHTTTRGNERNEPDGPRRTIEEISSSQSEVSGAQYKAVSYEGAFLGKVLRTGVKGQRWGHVFGYSKFDKDENAKLLGYRIEAWHDGKCIGIYDSLNAQKVKRFQIPEDWHVSFKYPEKFQYRSPFATKNVVRQ